DVLLGDVIHVVVCLFFSSRRRHTSSKRDWSSDVCSSDLNIFSPIRAVSSENIFTSNIWPDQLSNRRPCTANIMTIRSTSVWCQKIGRASCRERGLVRGCDVS